MTPVNEITNEEARREEKAKWEHEVKMAIAYSESYSELTIRLVSMFEEPKQ